MSERIFNVSRSTKTGKTVNVGDFPIYTLFQLAQVRDDNRYVNGFTDKLLRQSEIDLGASRDSMPCLLDEKKIVNYPCSRACPLFGDCVTKWYQVRKRA